MLPPLTPDITPPVTTFPKSKRCLACDYCREKKVRCDGRNPCSYCKNHHQSCKTSAKRRLQDASLDSQAVAQRLARIESLLENTVKTSSNINTSDHLTVTSTQPTNNEIIPTNLAPSISCLSNTVPECVNGPTLQSTWVSQTRENRVPLPQAPDSISACPTAYAGLPLPSDQARVYDNVAIESESWSDEQESSSVYSAHTYLEYQGPRSFMSICSQPGIEWINDKLNGPLFQHSASRFARDMTRRLKLNKKISSTRVPDPGVAVALRYCQTFFDRGYEAILGIVQRSWFEARLHAHLHKDEDDDGSSWYALRNIIYALGCRHEITSTTTLLESSEQSWPYFENALSVHTDLVFLPASIVGVQALVLMILEDEEINCDVPTSTVPEYKVYNDGYIIIIKLHQLSSLVWKSLSSAKAYHKTPIELIETVNFLDQKVRSLGEELNKILPIKGLLNPSCLPESVTLIMALAIQSFYNDLLFDIHTTLTYPWSRGIINMRQHPSFCDQVERSYSTVAQAARDIILSSKHIPLDAGSPFLITYYTPIYALMNLFVHILQRPTLPTVESDLLLMELGASHFTRLELVTHGQLSTPFARDIVQMARSMVERAKKLPTHSNEPPLITKNLLPSSLSNNIHMGTAQGPDLAENGMDEWLDMQFEPDLEMWSTLLPIVDSSPQDEVLFMQRIT